MGCGDLCEGGGPCPTRRGGRSEYAVGWGDLCEGGGPSRRSEARCSVLPAGAVGVVRGLRPARGGSGRAARAGAGAAGEGVAVDTRAERAVSTVTPAGAGGARGGWARVDGARNGRTSAPAVLGLGGCARGRPRRTPERSERGPPWPCGCGKGSPRGTGTGTGTRPRWAWGIATRRAVGLKPSAGLGASRHTRTRAKRRPGQCAVVG